MPMARMAWVSPFIMAALNFSSKRVNRCAGPDALLKACHIFSRASAVINAALMPWPVQSHAAR